MLNEKKYNVQKEYSYHIKTTMIYFDDADNEISDIYIFNKKNNKDFPE